VQVAVKNIRSGIGVCFPCIDSISLSALLLLASLAVATANGEDSQAWVASARLFVEGDRLFRENVQTPSFAEYLQKREDSAEAFRKSTPPSVDDIETLLYSESIENKKIACAAVYLSGKYSSRVVEYLVGILHTADAYELKRFSLFALRKVRLEDLLLFEDSIFEAIRNENTPSVLSEEILFLTDFPPECGAKIATHLLIYSNDEGIKRLSYTLLYKLGPAYTEAAVNELKMRDDKETLRIIEEMTNPT
jgi:hypothetical protein